MYTLNQLIQRLADSGVEFVVVGGYAGVLHGSALVTRDLEICAVLSPANVDRLRETLKDLHSHHRMTPQKLSFSQVPRPGETIHNLYLQTDWGTVDILSSVLGLGDFERLKSKAESFVTGGRKCYLMALEDLIAAKEAMGRERDRLAAKELRAIAAKRAMRHEPQ
ncbi:MAG: nucleotidyltransferase [Verrucomicrobia bacterium]|nr:nucleotidyltransferase [Verrucomicrobiota bacterium]